MRQPVAVGARGVRWGLWANVRQSQPPGARRPPAPPQRRAACAAPRECCCVPECVTCATSAGAMSGKHSSSPDLLMNVAG
ncbi:hypothetical protein K1T71_003823 [Dendrolimus kikuchii]|uniref:Uncharacterized protein n=1 Tax=Dendrolimus kikuchii TaxID=765133 RepID=A0ACC1D929_9NEOP|nr:hypothetical protein K1T71_003823 [Dendrolimus kikuchii]